MNKIAVTITLEVKAPDPARALTLVVNRLMGPWFIQKPLTPAERAEFAAQMEIAFASCQPIREDRRI